jgi:ABC-type Fe3+-hydroxamate transport system substrate-binding protein
MEDKKEIATKTIFNQGVGGYTYRNPKNPKEVLVLAPGKMVTLPVKDADVLLGYKGVVDTADKPKPGRTPQETEELIKDLQSRLEAAEAKLKEALKAPEEKPEKKEKK